MDENGMEKFSDPIDRNIDALTAETKPARLSFRQNKCCSLMEAHSFRSGLKIPVCIFFTTEFKRYLAIFEYGFKKREAGRKGSKASGRQAEMTAEGNPPVDTGSSPLCNECENSAIAEGKPFRD
ncbi:hypothetical protein T07_5224 [Trichinella nelsoni]|uniref:Uncharacterized protein n=1 Tax=Trichinella nelsoni TaxID=6336 RepID=A0A0V0RJX2_9BILA|nr:hypothetical protein T07_5224 [Trichinella nelsoni]